MLAFGNNASSIKGKVSKGTPLLFELEIRNFDLGDGKTSMVMQAVKIHFMERAPRRIDMSPNPPAKPKEEPPVNVEEKPKEEPVAVASEKGDEKKKE